MTLSLGAPVENTRIVTKLLLFMFELQLFKIFLNKN